MRAVSGDVRENAGGDGDVQPGGAPGGGLRALFSGFSFGAGAAMGGGVALGAGDGDADAGVRAGGCDLGQGAGQGGVEAAEALDLAGALGQAEQGGQRNDEVRGARRAGSAGRRGIRARTWAWDGARAGSAGAWFIGAGPVEAGGTRRGVVALVSGAAVSDAGGALVGPGAVARPAVAGLGIGAG